MIVFVGTYTEPVGHAPLGHGEGMYVFEFNTNTGELKQKIDHAFPDAGPNPTFLGVSKNKKWLYASSENYNTKDGQITAFKILTNSGLKKIDSYSIHGIGPCYQLTAFDDQVLLNATYFTGSVMSFRIDQQTGALTETSFHQLTAHTNCVPERQNVAHAHCVVVGGTDGKTVYFSDLGADRIYYYNLDIEKGLQVPPSSDGVNWVCLPEGSGPRHMAFNPTKTRLYISCELSSRVVSFKVAPTTGSLELIQIEKTLPDDFIKANENTHNVADIHCTPDGRFVYVSNRAHHSVTQFRVTQPSGLLEYVGRTKSGGEVPRNFLIDPSGRWCLVANQNTDNIVVFRVDPETGGLEPTGLEAHCPSPVVLQTFPEE